MARGRQYEHSSGAIGNCGSREERGGWGGVRERPSSAKRTRSVAATGSCRELVAQGSSSRPKAHGLAAGACWLAHIDGDIKLESKPRVLCACAMCPG